MKKIFLTQASAALMLLIIATTGCKKDVNPNDPNNGNESNDNLEYVDLGLPSGTLWANCNIGATIPEGYGNYYSWAEIEKKEMYKWDTYKYCNESANQLTKYCNDPEFGNEGYIDNLTILESGDNAAIALVGNEWCMPTKEQWDELLQNTTYTWTTQNDVNGYLFTANNGNTMFLPASDRIRGEEVLDLGNQGYYWSNMLDNENPRNAYTIVFSSEDIKTSSSIRYLGIPVRPVRAAVQ